LLGPLDVVADGVARPVQGERRKAVLAVLALGHGEVVATGHLLDAVWGDDVPPTAANTLQRHISYLRGVLGDAAAIVARSRGYVLSIDGSVGSVGSVGSIDGDGTDVAIAERLVARAAEEPHAEVRVGLLREALRLWRGRALADLPRRGWWLEQAERLDELWLRATRLLVETRLARGEHDELVPELRDLVAEHPYDEALHGQLMLALYRGGRQADALAAYRRLRETLDADLGIEPGPALRALEIAVLRQDPELRPPAAVAPHAASAVVPAQLPPAVPGFVGRAAELARLDALVPATAVSNVAGTPVQGGAATAAVAAVTGTGGVGKTALAVHWAHRVAARFPDGQLYVDLAGFDPAGAPLTTGEAVRGFLDALGVPADELPAAPAAQAALFRSLLAGRRVLVVLDNARDVAQIRPLLPGAPGSVVVVTSRDRLTGLVAGAAAHPVGLGVLSRDEARELLGHRLGPDRVTREPTAVDEIVAACAGLPLALAVAAARATTRPHLPLAALAVELRAARTLDALDTGDPATDVRGVLSWSYRALADQEARLFRFVGIHPGGEFSTAAAASLAGLPRAETARLLSGLAGAHLVTETTPGRYAVHDLLCAYAGDLGHQLDAPELRAAATHRMLDHYVQTAARAARLLYPTRGTSDPDAPLAGVVPEELPDGAAANAWFAAEGAVLAATVRHAVANGLDAAATRLADVLADFLDHRGRWHDQLAVQEAAVAAASRLGDLPAGARARHQLARACNGLGLREEAHLHLLDALDLTTRAGDLAGQARTEHNLAMVCDQQDRHAEALGHVGRALDLYRKAGDRRGEGLALNGVGWCHAQLGDHERAAAACEEALGILQEVGEASGEADAWDSLGVAHRHLGRQAEAIACYDRAIDLYRRLDIPYRTADSLSHLGDCHAASGDREAARAAWLEALDILTRLGHRDADAVRRRLATGAA
jgi:DNA-binding SARP family transcriptional activator